MKRLEKILKMLILGRLATSSGSALFRRKFRNVPESQLTASLVISKFSTLDEGRFAKSHVISYLNEAVRFFLTLGIYMVGLHYLQYLNYSIICQFLSVIDGRYFSI